MTALCIIISGISIRVLIVKFSCYSSHLGKKIQKKVPKRIHKAEREKMKREHLNELFLGLADALGNFLIAYNFPMSTSDKSPEVVPLVYIFSK